MKSVEAEWEVRNLGVNCVELTVSTEDTAEDLRVVVSQADTDYSVVRIPVARPDLIQVLNEEGFQFVECIIDVRHSLKLVGLSPILARLADSLTCKEVLPEGVASEIYDEMFATDRISLDSNFGRAAAANRYANWFLDEVRLGATTFEMLKDDVPIGFFVLRVDNDSVARSVLSGVYPTRGMPGLGGILLRKILEKSREFGATSLKSRISTNNVAVVRTHVENGFEFQELGYIFVKHYRSKLGRP